MQQVCAWINSMENQVHDLNFQPPTTQPGLQKGEIMHKDQWLPKSQNSARNGNVYGLYDLVISADLPMILTAELRSISGLGDQHHGSIFECKHPERFLQHHWKLLGWKGYMWLIHMAKLKLHSLGAGEWGKSHDGAKHWIWQVPAPTLQRQDKLSTQIHPR